MRVISFENERSRRGLPTATQSQASDLPEMDELLPSKSGRPGELHEHVPLGAAVANVLRARSKDLGLEPDVVAAIALEASRAFDLLGGHQDRQLRQRLSDDSTSVSIDRRRTNAEARYLRSLTSRRNRAMGEDVASIALSLRLTAGYSEAALIDGLQSPWLAEAVGWEIAAVTRGQTLTELILLSALERE